MSQRSTSPSDKRDRMVLISVHVPKQLLDELDELVREGRFPNRSEAIRTAIRDLILRERAARQRPGPGLDNVIVPGR
jgi:Arc/MetJ-type ribon-helix-helix transcriptional regulator